jgi:cysteine desulfurase
VNKEVVSPKTAIYFDYAATSPVASDVAEAMCACLTMDGTFANPASRSHIYGWQAEEKVEVARLQVADLLHCDGREIVWTSGATESNNLAIKGVFEALAATGQDKGHLITSVIEHKAVIDPVKWLQQQGVKVTWLEPDASGVISAEQVSAALRPDTRMVSLMQVNNETGVINPIAAIGKVCRDQGVLFHVDAAQAAGKLGINVEILNIDLLSLSAHKFYGPKGVGCLYVRRAIAAQVAPQIHGGGHERRLRSGTLPTHQLVGMGAAAELAKAGLIEEMTRIALLRDKLWQGIRDLPGASQNGSGADISPIHLNVCFSGVDGEMLLLSLRQLALSSGSACTSASMEPSYVLKAMGLSDADAHSSLRLSLGRFTTDADIEQAIKHICKTITDLQAA